MALTCTKCHGAAVPAAQMRTFEHGGQSLSCLVFVSSCIVCGHRWEDETYEAANLDNIEQACAGLASRQCQDI